MKSNPSRYVFDFRNQPLVVSTRDVKGNYLMLCFTKLLMKKMKHGNARWCYLCRH